MVSQKEEIKTRGQVSRAEQQSLRAQEKPSRALEDPKRGAVWCGAHAAGTLGIYAFFCSTQNFTSLALTHCLGELEAVARIVTVSSWAMKPEYC